jgi:thiamine transport system substrate-binding protein
MRIQSATVLVASGLLLAACSSATTEASDATAASDVASDVTSDVTSEVESATPGQEAGPTTVRLLTHDSFVVSQDLLDEFTASTGITVEIVTGGDAGTMVAGAVLAAGAPTADVLFGIDNTLITRAEDAGVFAPYASPELASVIPTLRQDTAGGLVTPIDYGDVCINIADAALADRDIPSPTSLDDLAAPEYRDLLVVEDPATSSPGLAFMLATIARYGDGWTDYWAQLRDNGVLVSGSWTDAYFGEFSGGGEGDRPLVVSYATSPPAEIVYAEDPKPTEPSTSVMTDGCYRQVEYAGLLDGSANAAAAGQVIDWLLSEPVQADVPLSMFVFPAREGTPLPPVFTDFAAAVDAPLQVAPEDVAANLTEWLSEWGSVMGR